MFEVRDVELREIKDTEVIVDVKACGFCGHDNILASYQAKDWEPFGHEFSGIVEKVGKLVTNVKVGDRVCVETATFDPLLDCSRNGRPDFDNTPCGDSFMELDKGFRTGMGFAEKAIVPASLCVKFDGMTFEEAAIMEPMGVAYDLFMTSDIKLNNDVLVLGCGPIGLMALQMAKAGGARKIYAAEFSTATARCEMAKNSAPTRLFIPIRLSLRIINLKRASRPRACNRTAQNHRHCLQCLQYRRNSCISRHKL